jgi:hypothetical protein
MKTRRPNSVLGYGNQNNQSSTNSKGVTTPFQKMIQHIQSEDPREFVLTNGSIYFYSSNVVQSKILDSCFIQSPYGSILQFTDIGDDTVQLLNIQFSNHFESSNSFTLFFNDFIELIAKFYGSTVQVLVELNRNFVLEITSKPSFKSMLDSLVILGFVVHELDMNNSTAKLLYDLRPSSSPVNFENDDFEYEYHLDND